jgi:zinc-finger binding domain of transposase IS66/Transposase C of IS166 homeodomain
MPQAVDALPDDPETLKAMLIAEQIRSERLAQIIKELQRHRFGRRAETLSEDQLLLALEDLEQREAGAAAKQRQDLPQERAAATRKRTAELCRRICSASKRLSTSRTRPVLAVGASFTVGEDVSEKLDVVPAQFRVLVVRRPKYACRACEDVVVQSPAAAGRKGRPPTAPPDPRPVHAALSEPPRAAWPSATGMSGGHIIVRCGDAPKDRALFLLGFNRKLPRASGLCRKGV